MKDPKLVARNQFLKTMSEFYADAKENGWFYTRRLKSLTEWILDPLRKAIPASLVKTKRSIVSLL